MGDLGFWIFIAAIVVAGIWEKSRRESERHETLRRIVEKTGTIDEAKLKELYSAAPSGMGGGGVSYRGLRIAGTIVMSIGAAIASFFLVLALVGNPVDWWFGGVGVAAGVAMLGLGIFFSARFAEPPSK
jgi:hypothetical protein